jgi:hypothetical protein
MESDLPDHTKAGSSLRHWPPGTNSKTFVPSFFVLRNCSEAELHDLRNRFRFSRKMAVLHRDFILHFAAV